MPAICSSARVRYTLQAAVYTALVCRAAAAGGSDPGATIQFNARSPHTVLWRGIYEHLPAVWKARTPLVVREVSDSEMDRLVAESGGDDNRQDDNSVVDGCFLDAGDGPDEPPSITLRQTLEGEDAALVFTHEYGHYVWAEILNDGERSQYERIWRTDRRHHHLVTGYAAESDEEGFAETFAYFIRKPELERHRDLDGFTFFRGMLTAHAADQSKG